MALKTVLESLDGIDAALQAHYVEKDGMFYLDLEEFGKHPGAVTLKTTLNKVNKERDDLKSKVTTLEARVADLPDDFDINNYVKREDAGKPDEQLATLRDQHARALAAQKATHQKEVDELKASLAERDAKIDGDTRRTALSAALDEAGIDPIHRPILLDHLGSKVKVRREDGGEPVAYVETDLGEVTPAEFVKDFASKAGKVYVAKPSGLDTKGSDNRRMEDNPFAKQAWSKTEQGRLIRSDRAKAERLAKSAGFKTLDDALKAMTPVAA